MKVQYTTRGKTSEEAPPFWSVQFEVVEGCNRKCPFCAIHSIRPKDNWDVYKMMSPKMFEAVTKQIGEYKDNPRIEFDNHGEPALHPEIIDFVRIARKNVKKASIQIQTNAENWYYDGGVKKVAKVASAMFANGLNIFALNGYNKKIFEDFQNNIPLLKKILPDDVEVIDFYYDNTKNISMYHKTTKKYFLILDDLFRANVKKSITSEKIILNQAGGVYEKVLEKLNKEQPPKGGFKKACSRPYREMCIGWNGSVAICCYDWSNAIVMGKFPEMTVKEIWNSKTVTAHRFLVSTENKCRNMSSCDVCDYKGGWRLGFLPKMKYVGGIKKAYKDLYEGMKTYKKFQYPGKYHVNGKTYNINKESLDSHVKTLEKIKSKKTLKIGRKK